MPLVLVATWNDATQVRWGFLLDVERRKSHLRAVLGSALGGGDERGREICEDVLEGYAELQEVGRSVLSSAASATADFEHAELALGARLSH